MGGFPFEQQFFIALQALALVALCLRLSTSGLYRIYTRFFYFLLSELVQVAALAFLPATNPLYRYLWMITEALIVAASASVVLETYTNIFRDFPGIASVSRRYIKVALGVAVVASLLLVGLEKAPSTIIQYFLVCDRVAVSSLLLLVLSAMIFLVYYPIPLNRNAVMYSIGFAVYLLARAVNFFIANLKYSSWYRAATVTPIAVSAACFLFWLFTLRPSGENKKIVVGHQWKQDDGERLLSQLRDINASLLRAAKK